jgi:hypothetical protein
MENCGIPFREWLKILHESNKQHYNNKGMWPEYSSGGIYENFVFTRAVFFAQ